MEPYPTLNPELLQFLPPFALPADGQCVYLLYMQAQGFGGIQLMGVFNDKRACTDVRNQLQQSAKVLATRLVRVRLPSSGYLAPREIFRVALLPGKN